MKITITRALAEIKLIKSKLKKITERMTFPVDVYVNGVGGVGNQSKEDFIKSYQSAENQYIALVVRLNKIKSAIAKVNTETHVKIPNFSTGKTIEATIYEAILIKNSFKDMKEEYITLRGQYIIATNKYNKEKAKIDNKVEEVIKQLYGNKASQISKDAISKTKDDIEAAYEVEYVEAIKKEELEKRINDLSEHITEIDLVLSEVNATTEITIED